MMPEDFSPVAKYFTGGVVGIVFSGTLYGLCMAGAIPIQVVIVLVSIKLVGGIALCFNRDWRAVGAGLVTSVPLAVMIFVTICFAVVLSQPMQFH